MGVQSPRSVVMIRPHHFAPNPSTARDNTFQVPIPPFDPGLAVRAYEEVSVAIEALRGHGVTVHVFEDIDDNRPDSVFPNNWFSTHSGGHIAVYPMFTQNRRQERRSDVLEFLKRNYRVQDVIDYSGLEQDDVFLEGTGAMVLDHAARVAYVSRSRRADPIALERFCTNFGYEPMVFDAVDEEGFPVYHTNVLMCIATEFALIGLSLLTSPERREHVADRLAEHGRKVIELSARQVREFAGNAIELETGRGRILALSTRAALSLTHEQRAAIEESCTLVSIDVPTLELAGGSLRCMIAGVHLDARS